MYATFRGKHQRQAGGKPPQIFRLGLAQIIDRGDEYHQRPGDDVDVVANVARIVEQVGRNQEDETGKQRPFRPSQSRSKYGKATKMTPNKATGMRDVKSLSPNSQYEAAVAWNRNGPCINA